LRADHEQETIAEAHPRCHPCFLQLCRILRYADSP
jgi:hypothetical protein